MDKKNKKKKDKNESIIDFPSFERQEEEEKKDKPLSLRKPKNSSYRERDWDEEDPMVHEGEIKKEDLEYDREEEKDEKDD